MKLSQITYTLTVPNDTTEEALELLIAVTDEMWDDIYALMLARLHGTGIHMEVPL